MGLRVNQNIAAMQGHYYMQVNEGNFNKAIERLSSGLRINRGADDPAGLIISEKYRAQVEGLQQAINNSQDGIGMIQTAEGALDEMSRILRGMRNLALHASNTAPNDTAAIAADQEQIESAVATLTRIGNNTQFGTKKLLDGSAGVTGVVSSSNVTFIAGTADTVSGTYAVTVTACAQQGYIRGANSFSAACFVGTAATNAIATTDTAVTLAFDGQLVSFDFAIAAGTSLASIVASLNANATFSGAGLTASDASGKLKIVGNKIGSFTVQASNATLASMTGITTAAAGDWSANTIDASEIGSIYLTEGETLGFRDVSTGENTTVNIAAGTSISTAISSIQSALDSAGIDVTVAYNDTFKSITFTNDNYGGTGAAPVQMYHTGTADKTTNLGLGSTVGSYIYIANGATDADGLNGQNVAGSIGGVTGTGSGQTLSVASGDPNGLSLRIAGNVMGDMGTVTVTKGALQFQVGAFAGQTVSTVINDVRSNQLGTAATGITAMTSVNVAAIDVTDGFAYAQDAIRVLDQAISDISTIRGNLGAFQKDVLESTVRNLGVAKQNMASSESQIRDADMAQEMLSFSRSQILQQTGMAMLAQANTAPNQILGLFRM